MSTIKKWCAYELTLPVWGWAVIMFFTLAFNDLVMK